MQYCVSEKIGVWENINFQKNPEAWKIPVFGRTFFPNCLPFACVCGIITAMFSDTHFHLLHTAERGVDMSEAFSALASRSAFFALEIGTHCDDLDARLAAADSAVSAVCDDALRSKLLDLLYFSAGIWPAPEAIGARFEQVAELERRISAARSADTLLSFKGKKLCALGECGLDHHWNPSGADNRSESDFSAAMLTGEAELFEMQLELARKFGLPVIVHSRDAFDGTLSCIANVGYDCGVIHCYSYGIAEARAFIDRGWYVSFSGAVTYTKRSKMPEMTDLLRFIPRDRLLLETDSPYLAPVPYRGKPNTPVLVELVYRYVADALNLPPETLSALVDANIRDLFGIGR